jgi:hypothetical protein
LNFDRVLMLQQLLGAVRLLHDAGSLGAIFDHLDFDCEVLVVAVAEANLPAGSIQSAMDRLLDSTNFKLARARKSSDTLTAAAEAGTAFEVSRIEKCSH